MCSILTCGSICVQTQKQKKQSNVKLISVVSKVFGTRHLVITCDNISVCLLQEIRRDAFWLQRRVSSAFGSMDAAEAQQLAEKIFKTLEVQAFTDVCPYV
jgi:aldehyde:ferredoxin oxidoreductase